MMLTTIVHDGVLSLTPPGSSWPPDFRSGVYEPCLDLKRSIISGSPN